MKVDKNWAVTVSVVLFEGGSAVVEKLVPSLYNKEGMLFTINPAVVSLTWHVPEEDTY